MAHELRRFGFSADWLPVVDDMLAQVLGHPLEPGGRVRLAGVPRARRLEQARVHLSARRLRRARAARPSARGNSARGFAEAIEELAFARVSGFMRGFIDLVFEDGGRYWIVDYKSNWLGPSVDDYAADRLPPVMARE